SRDDARRNSYPRHRSQDAPLPRSPSPVGRRSRKPLGYPSQVQILPWAFLWRDQCNFSKLSLYPNLYDPCFTGLAQNTKAVLAFHPPVVLQDRFEFGVPCRIHDGLGSRAFTEALRHERVDGLLHESRAEGLQPSELDARDRLELLLQLPQHGRRPVIQRPVLPAHRDQRLMQLISQERLAFCQEVQDRPASPAVDGHLPLASVTAFAFGMGDDDAHGRHVDPSWR